jgi:plastocyanin
VVNSAAPAGVRAPCRRLPPGPETRANANNTSNSAHRKEDQAMKPTLRVIIAAMLPMLLSAAAAAILPGAAAVHAAPAAQAGSQTWTVLAGGQSAPVPGPDRPTSAWTYTRFYPDKITVHVGDTIIWKLNSMEIHQIVFPAPGQAYLPFTQADPANPQAQMVNPLVAFPQGGPQYDGTALAGSGLLGAPPSYTKEYRLTFTRAGTFPYLCPMHTAQLPGGQVAGMTGAVTVVAADQPLLKTPAQIDADAQAALTADNQAAAAAEPAARQAPPPTAGPNGTTIYHGNIGWDSGALSYMRFAPADFTIHVGDTIEWTQTSNQTPHTVTLYSGQAEPPQFITQPQPGGPPKILFNPAAFAPAGGRAYDGAGTRNSGFMPGKQDPAPGPRAYSLTFTQPGAYEYLCVLHDEMGMNGRITVLPVDKGTANAAPGMPRTGKPGREPRWELISLAAGALLALGGLCVGRRVRS